MSEETIQKTIKWGQYPEDIRNYKVIKKGNSYFVLSTEKGTFNTKNICYFKYKNSEFFGVESRFATKKIYTHTNLILFALKLMNISQVEVNNNKFWKKIFFGNYDLQVSKNILWRNGAAEKINPSKRIIELFECMLKTEMKSFIVKKTPLKKAKKQIRNNRIR